MIILFNFIFIFASFVAIAFFIGGSFARLFALLKEKFDKDAEEDDAVVAKKVSINLFLLCATSLTLVLTILTIKFLCQVIGII